MPSKFIAVSVDGVVQIHALSDDGIYATLCGLDGEDDSVGQETVPLPAGAKINCEGCKGIIRMARKYKESDLAK